MFDRLEVLLKHFSVSADMFHAGALCGINDIGFEDGSGQLHLVRQGTVAVSHSGRTVIQVTEPSLLLYPRPLPHRFISDQEQGADFTCARLFFDGGVANPIAATLPAFICLPLSEVTGAEGVLELLFEEAFLQRCGRRALVNRLFEVVLIQILRHLMESGQIKTGMLAGMAHPQLRYALVAMHKQPAVLWSLEMLADNAGMSRSVFANTFRDTVGCTPGIYLQRWRIALAQQALKRGQPLKIIAIDVGYGSEAALSRAFKAQTGLSPREWKQQLQQQ
ncbi:AraC family transcriptional regulator [Chromatiaceae bacterium AAb-1]|nr:AraC family transcriptional regulator [Chromatiaceae bacterium AAb-1]